MRGSAEEQVGEARDSVKFLKPQSKANSMSLKSFFFASMIIGVLLGYRQHFASANDDFAQYHYAYRLNEPRNQIILVDPSNPALPPQIKTLPVGTKLWTGRGQL